MTTAEMERRLVVALRSADSVPVDVTTARDRLMRGEMDRRQATRRRLVAAVAAAAVVAGLTVAVWHGSSTPARGFRRLASSPVAVRPPRRRR